MTLFGPCKVGSHFERLENGARYTMTFNVMGQAGPRKQWGRSWFNGLHKVPAAPRDTEHAMTFSRYNWWCCLNCSYHQPLQHDHPHSSSLPIYYRILSLLVHTPATLRPAGFLARSHAWTKMASVRILYCILYIMIGLARASNLPRSFSTVCVAVRCSVCLCVCLCVYVWQRKQLANSWIL